VAFVVPLVLTGTAGAANAAGAAPAEPRTTVASDRPSYVTAEHVRGAVPDAAPVSFRVDLAQRDQAGLDALLRQVTTPGSSSYRSFLTSAQYRARFAPSQSSVDAVSAWLRGQGFRVDAVSAGGTTLTVSGTAGRVWSGFGAALKTFDAGKAGALQAPDRALRAPASIAGAIRGVRGLAQLPQLNTPSLQQPDVPGSGNSRTRDPGKGQQTAARGGGAPPAPGFLNAPPCSTYFGEKPATGTPRVNGKVAPYVPCGYTPQQLRSAYKIDTAINGRARIDGRGTTVAITDAYNSPTIVADAQQYSAQRGLPGFAAGQYTTLLPSSFSYGYNDKVNGDQCGEQGWYGEQTLDVEAVHGLAPGANVLYVAAANCTDDGFLEALSRIVDNHLADEISNSWGSSGEASDVATLQSYQQIFAQAAIEGIGVYFSSGDSGDETGGDPTVPAQVDLPASNPLVTAVGGTGLGVGSRGQYLFEDGWGTGSSKLVNGAWTPAPPGDYLYGGPLCQPGVRHPLPDNH